MSESLAFCDEFHNDATFVVSMKRSPLFGEIPFGLVRGYRVTCEFSGSLKKHNPILR